LKFKSYNKRYLNLQKISLLKRQSLMIVIILLIKLKFMLNIMKKN